MLPLFLYAWLAPAALLTLWTLVVFILARVVPLRTPLQNLVGGHVLLLMYNPKDEFLYRRPTVNDALLLLGVGLVPVINLLMLVFQLWFTPQSAREGPVLQGGE